jgi:hypothetical protein
MKQYANSTVDAMIPEKIARDSKSQVFRRVPCEKENLLAAPNELTNCGLKLMKTKMQPAIVQTDSASAPKNIFEIV